jgi:serine/threonine-protein kinase RsbW
VDWLLDARHDDATAAAVKAVEDYLLRHTSDESLVLPAVETAQDTLVSAARQVRDGELLWLHVDWSRLVPTLKVHTVDRQAASPDGADGPDPGPSDSGRSDSGPSDPGPSDPGRLVFGHLDPVHRERLRPAVSGEPTAVQLPTPREVVVDFDADHATLLDLAPLEIGPPAATIALAAAAESHPVAAPDQVAAAAGALLADAVVRDHSELRGTQDVIDLFGRLHEALGGGYRSVRADDGGFELIVDKSPFGPAVRQIPSLSRLSEAIVGRLAARAHGKATVVHDESIALGDPADRLRVFLGDVGDELCGSTYAWPPAGTHEKADASPRLEMTVSLPRQSHSVPVIRRLAAQILRAFGVAGDSIHDVELAISEACANVIQHAIDSEGYEVTIELGADRCAITVLDRGDGFDALNVEDQHDHDAESGRGLQLMRALVDNLNFVSEPKVGAVVHMVKQLDYDDSHPFRRTESSV